MNLMNIGGLRVLLIAIMLPLVAACSAAPKPGIEAMPDREYLKADQSAREAYLSSVSESAYELERKYRVEYMAGIPIRPGGDKHAYVTIQRDPITGLVAVYHSNDPHGVDGPSSEGMYVTFTDAKGDTLWNRDQYGNRAPIVALANVATEEDFGRVVTKVLGNVLAGAASNIGAAAIASSVNNGCKDKCGTSIVNVPQSFASAVAKNTAIAQQEQSAKVGVNTVPMH